MAWLQAPSIWGWSGSKMCRKAVDRAVSGAKVRPAGKPSSGFQRRTRARRRLCCFQQTEPACLLSVRPQKLSRASLSFPKSLIILLPNGRPFGCNLCARGCPRAQPEILRPKPGDGFPFDLWAEVSRKRRPGPRRRKRNSERSELFSV